MKAIILSIVVLAAAAGMMGCGAQSSDSIPLPTGYLGTCVAGEICTESVANPTGTLPTYATGDTESMTVANGSILDEYEGCDQGGDCLQDPGPVQVNISLTQQTTTNPIAGGTPYVYLGTMTIQFQDVSTLHVGQFTTGPANQSYTSNKTYYNNVSSQFGNTYRIFFEDPMGALVLTITTATGTDTGNVSSGSGQIWFYNFPPTDAPNPLYQGDVDQYGNYYAPGDVFCWELATGPYDCQNFGIPPTTSSGNVPAYTLLGTVPTINLTAALGI